MKITLPEHSQVTTTCSIEMERKRCSDCWGILTEEEARYYEYRCEQCERDWMKRIDKWMSGSDDLMLDIQYGVEDEKNYTY